MEKRLGSRKTRRPYRKPQMEQVQLVAEEAVLAACSKVNTGPKEGQLCGQGGGTCNRLVGS
jgi:hypothetical protein